jgi:hypothetical protein
MLMQDRSPQAAPRSILPAQSIRPLRSSDRFLVANCTRPPADLVAYHPGSTSNDGSPGSACVVFFHCDDSGD